MAAAVALFGLGTASVASADSFGFYYSSGPRYCAPRPVVRYVEPVYDYAPRRVYVSDCGPTYVRSYPRYYSVPRYSRGISFHYSSSPRYYGYRGSCSPYRSVRVYRH